MSIVLPFTVKAWTSAARDVLALFFTPIVTAILIWLIVILAYGAWEAKTQELRINYLGALAISFSVLIGLGGQWFQRNRLNTLKFNGPGGISGELNAQQEGAEPPEVEVTTTTTTETTVNPAETK
jgi:hypothetical protein